MSSIPVVTVGAKRTQEYILSTLSNFNRGASHVELIGVGDCISRAAEVARMVKCEFGATIGEAKVSELQRGEDRYACCRLRVGNEGTKVAAESYVPGEFVSFPTYHLLLDYLLATEGQLTVGTQELGHRLLTIKAIESGFQVIPGDDLQAILAKPPGDQQKKGPSAVDRVASALYRTGFVLSERCAEIANKLGRYDDIVLGLDTNVLLDCVVTQQLLDALTFSCHSEYSPNWILLVVPNTVMHELEQAANARDDRGKLSEIGRKGYRALQEILELDQSKDLKGVSLLIVGDVDPVLDARVELRGLREDFKRAAATTFAGRFSPKQSVGDALIRDQFRAFLRQLSFHKGVFFLTADKSNSALAQAEGLRSLYLAPAYSRKVLNSAEVLMPPQAVYDGERFPLSVPFGRLIYELAVQFGSISVSSARDQLHLDCDLRGDSLEHWSHRDLRIRHTDLRRLLALYREGAKISLARAETVWLAEYLRAAA